MLTGDSSDTAKAIGHELGVDESIGDLLPEQKVDKIRELLRRGRKVAMVGDGVNDAPALAEATVGIAMGQGTDVALETADVTLMTSDLSRLVEVLAIGKRCYRVIMFNFWGTSAWIPSALYWRFSVCLHRSSRRSFTSARNWPSSSIPPGYSAVSRPGPS